MTKNFEERPILVQGSDAPIVIRKGEELPPLICDECKESVLVKNYLAECFVGIGLQCYKCNYITWTPSLPKGEVFPKTTLTLGRIGRYLMGSSVVNSKDVVMTCDQELDVASKLTSPSNSSGNNFELSIENLDLLSAQLDVFSGGKFKKYLESARRSITHRNSYFRENPLAWSIELLKEQLSRNELQMNNSTLVALGFLQGYRDIFERWKNHVHFPIMANEICAYFYHSLVQLIAASYLVDHGNKIAINASNKKDGKRSADLYVRLSGSENLFLEVKGPEALEWTQSDITSGKMRKCVEKCLSKSRGQIDIDNPGMLIIGTTCLKTDFLQSFESVVEKVLKTKGKNYPGVAVISIIGLKEVTVGGSPNSGAKVSTSFNVSMSKNKYYFKENPIRT